MQMKVKFVVSATTRYSVKDSSFVGYDSVSMCDCLLMFRTFVFMVKHSWTA